MGDLKNIADGKTEYLQMIQEPIGRMSTSSALFKGFSATIVAGISALSYADVRTLIMVLSFIPVLTFAALDIYYLQLEKKYRFLYEQVRTGSHPVNFSMDLSMSKKEKKLGKARIIDCISSPSILLFYPAMILILSIVTYLKTKGVI